jgi:Alpha/beta hydrolase domain
MKRWLIPHTLVLILTLCLGRMASLAPAEVTRVEINSRELVARPDFGDTGPYERLTGRIYFAVDPSNPRNQVIVDLDLAPRNAEGRVEMSATLEILAPQDPEMGNGVALFDIANRGNKVALQFNHGGGGDEFGDGFLMREGFTIVWVGWESDVAARPGAVRIQVPAPGGYPVGGLGLAAIRDAASWLQNSADAVVPVDHAVAFGLSQSGRFLRTYLYLGFNSDESGRRVFDGVMAHIGGASRIDLNRRGATPTSLGAYDATSFPFADDAWRDPVTGVSEGELDNARARENPPRVFYTNTGVEYWGGGRVAALIHTTPDGTEDIPLPDNVRFYFLAGSQHGPAAFPPTQARNAQQIGNPMDYWWPMRALLVAMTDWVTEDVAPPASAYPTFAASTLVAPADIGFPAIPGVRSPSDLDAGRRAANLMLQGIGGPGAPLPLLVPAVDADGNETSGIRHPELAVPLATYTGWNFTNPDVGDPSGLVALAGSYIPFASSIAEREDAGDPRPSIQERYGSRESYLDQVRSAGEALVGQRYLLADDLTPILERAGEHWDWRMGAR